MRALTQGQCMAPKKSYPIWVYVKSVLYSTVLDNITKSRVFSWHSLNVRSGNTMFLLASVWISPCHRLICDIKAVRLQSFGFWRHRLGRYKLLNLLRLLPHSWIWRQHVPPNCWLFIQVYAHFFLLEKCLLFLAHFVFSIGYSAACMVLACLGFLNFKFWRRWQSSWTFLSKLWQVRTLQPSSWRFSTNRNNNLVDARGETWCFLQYVLMMCGHRL